MKNFLALPVIALLSACTSERPIANLAFVDITPSNDNFQVVFQSSVQFFKLFSKNRHRRPLLSELVCSLEADGKLEFEHRQERFAKGSVEPTGTPMVGGTFQFQSAIQFWRVPKDGMDSDVMLTSAELAAALKGKRTIPCIVRMTIYLSQPYYTKPMHVPVQRILAAMPAEQN